MCGGRGPGRGEGPATGERGVCWVLEQGGGADGGAALLGALTGPQLLGEAGHRICHTVAL